MEVEYVHTTTVHITLSLEDVCHFLEKERSYKRGHRSAPLVVNLSHKAASSRQSCMI